MSCNINHSTSYKLFLILLIINSIYKFYLVKTIITFISILILTASFSNIHSQELLEVEGKARISTMDKVNNADSVVVRLSDGTLAVRDVSTLNGVSVGQYGTVVNPVTGKVWLDRNLGATQVATSSTDAASYGDLYQWGRGADGHQERTSSTTTTQATNWLAGGGSWNGSFIIEIANWLSTGETHMWSGTAAENNPCPSGFRIPTNAEWEQERLTWLSNDATGAFGSPLKLPAAGGRNVSDGLLSSVSSVGASWSSTVESTGARGLAFLNNDAAMVANERGEGFSVRCIQD